MIGKNFSTDNFATYSCSQSSAAIRYFSMRYVSVLLFSILLTGSFYSSAQDTTRFEEKIIGKWRLVFYDVEGEIVVPEVQNSNDRVEFNKDHSMFSFVNGGMLKGTWVYDPVTRLFVWKREHDGEESRFIVVHLQNQELLLEYKEPETNRRIRLMMKPAVISY